MAKKSYWLKGGLIGLIAFVIVFIVLSLINTGQISISDAFGFKDPESIFNYIWFLLL